MAKRRNPVRLVVALSIAAALSVFLLVVSLGAFGSSTPSLRPSQLAEHSGNVSLAGRVVGPVHGDARGAGLRFRLRDIDGSATVPVVYAGSVPDLFRVGRDVYMQGELRAGTFVAERDSLVTKCPSKYAPKES